MKIGFIDYYLDEWHANNYPDGLKKASDGKARVAFAYAMADSPDGLTTDEWCEKYGVTKCESIEELVEKSDAVIVLSPDNFEYHEQLAQCALKSGKPCFVDKTFAPTKEAAKRMFELAKQHNTPMFSTSSLRFATELEGIDSDDIAAVCINGTAKGPNLGLDIYLIHLIEPIFVLMKECPKRLMIQTAADRFFSLTMEYESGRLAVANGYMNGAKYTFTIARKSAEKTFEEIKSNFFAVLYKKLIEFFETGIPPVDSKETIAIMAVREKAAEALKNPSTWIEI